MTPNFKVAGILIPARPISKQILILDLFMGSLKKLQFRAIVPMHKEVIGLAPNFCFFAGIYKWRLNGMRPFSMTSKSFFNQDLKK
jgi:hypothetical protein